MCNREKKDLMYDMIDACSCLHFLLPTEVFLLLGPFETMSSILAGKKNGVRLLAVLCQIILSKSDSWRDNSNLY